MVQDGVGYWYVGTCLFQAGWTLAFAYEIIPLAVVLIILIWLTLVGLVYSQYYAVSDGTLCEFWFLRFPFSLHCGWLTAASTLNVNVQAVASGASAEIQLAMGIISLAYLHAVSVWVLFGFGRGPNYTIAFVIAWAAGWIYNELQTPKDSITALLDDTTIRGVSYAAFGVAMIVVAQMVVRVAAFGVNRFLCKKTTTRNDTNTNNAKKTRSREPSEESSDDEEAGNAIAY